MGHSNNRNLSTITDNFGFSTDIMIDFFYLKNGFLQIFCTGGLKNQLIYP